MGSLAIIAMALRGFGWRSIAVCSKRGLSLVEGRGRWLVVQVVAKLGDCGAGTLVASLSVFVETEAGAGVEKDLAERVLRERWTRRRPSIVSDVAKAWNGTGVYYIIIASQKESNTPKQTIQPSIQHSISIFSLLVHFFDFNLIIFRINIHPFLI